MQNIQLTKGDPVVIVSKFKNAEVSTSGIAIKSGNIGDLLEVKNTRSGIIIKGILKKNKIIITKKNLKQVFLKKILLKPVTRLKSNIINYKEEKIKDKNRLFRRVENYKYDTSRKFNHGLNNLWKGAGSAGINFLNVLPKLGITVKNFFGNLFTDVFNSIYNQQIDQKSARNVIIGFFHYCWGYYLNNRRL